MTQTLIEKYDLQKYLKKPIKEQKRKSIDDSLNQNTFGIESLGLEELAAEEARLVYPALNLEFLSLKHPQKEYFEIGWHNVSDDTRGSNYHTLSLPRFAVYSLQSPECVLSVDAKYWFFRRSIKTPEILPESISIPFLSAVKFPETSLEKQTYNGSGTYEYKSSFKGIIPENVRSMIKEAKKLFHNNIFVISEAEAWDAKSIPMSVVDPLIIGCLGKESFLIDQFSCTPIEDYVCKEFKES